MATVVEIVTTLLSVGGMFFMLLALVGARAFAHDCRRIAAAEANAPGFAPDVTLLKPVKGVDARMYQGLASHCRQQYAGRFEILFGVSSADDPAVQEISRLQQEFPQCDIRLILCPQRLGTSGKVSNLVQMLPEAKYPYILINDSDIRVSPNYLARVMARFGGTDGKEDPKVGMVTALFLGRTAPDGPALTLWARLEALAISTDFMAGVLAARKLEGGVHFGLGATLAMSREALARAGGLEPLVDILADDFELGVRIERAGYRIGLSSVIVETTVPSYNLQVPANRLGSQVYSPDQLKVIQEVITLSVFGVFTVFYFGDRLLWNHAAAAGCLVAGAFFMFHKF